MCAKFHCANGCGDIAVARQNNRACLRSLLLERLNDIQAFSLRCFAIEFSDHNQINFFDMLSLVADHDRSGESARVNDDLWRFVKAPL